MFLKFEDLFGFISFVFWFCLKDILAIRLHLVILIIEVYHFGFFPKHITVVGFKWHRSTVVSMAGSDADRETKIVSEIHETLKKLTFEKWEGRLFSSP